MAIKQEVFLALVAAHRDRDEDKFRAIVKSASANAVAAGQGKFAQALDRLLGKMDSTSMGVLLPLPHDVAGLLTMTRPSRAFTDMVLGDEEKRAIRQVLTEQRQRDRLSAAGLEPARKLLLSGPPGVGKTMTAAVLATELEIPLARVNLHAVIASHLGETSAHLRKVFDHIATERAVYLFDEFDALGAARDADESDVAEMRRVLNSLLQFIEEDRSTSLIVGATNLPEILDHALHRRFDTIIEYHMPSEDEARELVRRAFTAGVDLANAGADLDVERATLSITDVLGVADGRRVARIQLGHADIIAACHATAKQVLLHDVIPYVGTPTDLLVQNLRHRVRS